MKEDLNILEQTAQNEYKYGFVTDIDTDVIPKGLNEAVIELISKKKERAGMDAPMALEGFRPLAQT